MRLVALGLQLNADEESHTASHLALSNAFVIDCKPPSLRSGIGQQEFYLDPLEVVEVGGMSTTPNLLFHPPSAASRAYSSNTITVGIAISRALTGFSR